jgi:hypothetical protein
MNKITKVGLSALCGSLASIATSNAGTLDVTGTATATWTSLSNTVTGNPIGMNTGLTFKGNGELDGGQTFSVTIAQTDKATWSSSNITLNTNSLGTFILSSAEGGQGIGGYDDNMPRAWEEVWDTGIATNANFQKGVGSSTNVSWTSPKVGAATFQIAWAPDNDGVQNANKGVSGSANYQMGQGVDIVMDIDMQADMGGVQFFLGGSRTELATAADKAAGRARALSGDHEEAVAGLILTLGPVEFGGQISAERLRTRKINTPEYYANSSWGLAFNVNDDLSISYSEARHLQTKTHKDANSQTNELNSIAVINEYTPKSWMRGDSIQIAYTIGGVGLKYAQTTYDNTGFSFDAKVPKEARVLAVSLAF